MSDQENAPASQKRLSLKERVLGFLSLPIQGITAFESVEERTDYAFKKGFLDMRKAPDSNDYYLMARFSNRYRDRDVFAAPHKGGEIISDKAHRSYISFLDEHPEHAPELWSLHIPGTARKNRAHWWAYDGAFIYAEFRLTEKEAQGVYNFVQIYEPGLSHGFYVYSYDKDNAVIEDYYTYEVSILPLDMAANAWTTFDLIRKEYNMGKFSPEHRAALVALHGEAYVAGLETDGEKIREHLDQLEVDTKALKTPVDQKATGGSETAPGDVQEDTDGDTAPLDEKTILTALQTLHEAIGNDIKSLRNELVERIEALEEYDEERVEAKALSMPKSLLLSWQPASVIGQVEGEVAYNSPLGRSRPKQAKAHANGHTLAGMFDGEEDDDE